MPTRKIKLLILLVTCLAIVACAKPKYELPEPLMADDSASGWRNY